MAIARLTWTHPETNESMSYDLAEGAKVTIGRAASNEISVPHVTVSRQHAGIEYTDGMFLVKDLGSSADTLALTTDILAGVAIVGIGAGVVLWFLDDGSEAKESDAKPAATAKVQWGIGLGTVTAKGHF